jgi:hypothetical protein
MSKFLTPPVWYDKNGNLNQMLIGDARNTTSGLQSNIAIGESSLAGAVDGVGGSLSIGYGAKAKSDQTIVVGAFSDASDGGIAIGYGISVVGGGIGIGGSATANQIQLGNPSSRYDLKIGNNIGTINGINLFQAFASDGRTVLSASSANMIKSVKVDAGESAYDIIITKLSIGAIYVMAVRFLHASKGNIHSSFILVNTANPSGTIFFGSGCPFLGVSTPVCARYISQTSDSDGAKGKIDIVQISNGAFSTCPEATMESVCAFRIN